MLYIYIYIYIYIGDFIYYRHHKIANLLLCHVGVINLIFAYIYIYIYVDIWNICILCHSLLFFAVTAYTSILLVP